MDWLASVSELVGGWMVGSRSRYGFLVNLVGNILWIAVALTTEVKGLILVSVAMGVVNARNFLLWGRQGGRNGEGQEALGS